MFEIINQRDVILQHAAVRFDEPEPAAVTIIPGYTGITLSSDRLIFLKTRGADGLWTIYPDRIIFTASLKGIPVSVPITWQTGYTSYSPTAPNFQIFYETPTNIILTDTGDPLVKTVEASSYPKSSTSGGLDGPHGYVRVKVTYGGTDFYSDPIQIITM